MSEPIKICYSWLGPRGPIMNTELPNLLSFAAVGEEVRTESHKFWTDNIWNEIFINKPDYQLSPICIIEDDTTFVFPYTLMWRIPFNYYFIPSSGIIEFSHTPESVVHHVRCSKGYFLIDLSAEAFVQDPHLSAMHSYFSEYHKIPMYKIIYLTGCMNAGALYDYWCERNNITDPRDKMNIISFPTSQDSIARHYQFNPETPIPQYNPDILPEKLFLSWNRRFRPHRFDLVLGLEKEGLVDRSYISMGLTDPENALQRFESSYDIHRCNNIGIEQHHVDTFINRLPLVLDGETNIVQMCGDFNRAAAHFYENSLISLVTETNYDLAEVTLTEKSFKPMKEMHPFICVGARGTLSSLRNLGYKTFSEFWDESYDDEYDHANRMRKILDICRYIGTWTPEHILSFKKSVQPIVEHNNLIVRGRCAFRIAKKIHDIIRGNE